MVITFFFPSVKNTQDRINNLVNFQRAYTLKSGQFSARDNSECQESDGTTIIAYVFVAISAVVAWELVCHIVGSIMKVVG